MMAHLLPLLLIAHVYAPGATVSYETGNTWDNGAHLTDWRTVDPLLELTEPPHQAERVGNSTVLDAYESAITAALITGGCDCTTSVAYPDVSGVTWDTEHGYRYGVQIEGVDGPNPPTAGFVWNEHGSIDKVNAILAYLRVLDAVHQTEIRDVGLAPEVAHVAIVGRFYDGITPEQLQASHADTLQRWTALGISGVHAIIRIGTYTRGSAQSVGYSCDGLRDARIPWNVLQPPTSDNMMIMLATFAHEFGHLVLDMPHTQCIDNGMGGRIEECQSDDGCHPDPSMKPPIDAVTYMGYCYWEYGYPFASIRLGPVMSPYARLRLQQAPAGCFPAISSFAKGTADPDGDEYPTGIDTCPATANRKQYDWYLVPHCSGCAIDPTATRGTAWPLLLALPLWWRRKRR